MIASVITSTAGSPKVSSLQFCPRFLNKDNPKLTLSVAFGEGWLAPLAGDPVIDQDSSFVAIDVEINHVASCIVSLIIFKQILNILWFLSDGSQCCQVIAVSNTTLLNILGGDVIIVKCDIVKDIASALPCKFCSCRAVFLCIIFIPDR